MKESSSYRGKHLIGKIFLLRVIENSSCKNSSYGRKFDFLRKKLNREKCSPSSHRKFKFQKFELWKKHNMEKIWVFSSNMNSLLVVENSGYKRSSYRSSTVFRYLVVLQVNSGRSTVIQNFRTTCLNRTAPRLAHAERHVCRYNAPASMINAVYLLKTVLHKVFVINSGLCQSCSW
jgi:hypothetical protein